MSAEIVRFETAGPVALIAMDDGKANALSHEMIASLHGALDRADAEGKSVVITGRPDRFCAGFDLRVLLSSPESARELLIAGANLYMRIYEFRLPVVMACTGHALAGGALLAATGDIRIGARGAYKIGLNEVTNGMPMPILAHQLARDRLDPRELVASVMHAKIYDPDEAAKAGWLDVVVEPAEVAEAAMREAERLAALSGAAYALTKASLRRASIDHIRGTLEEDLAALGR